MDEGTIQGTEAGTGGFLDGWAEDGGDRAARDEEGGTQEAGETAAEEAVQAGGGEQDVRGQPPGTQETGQAEAGGGPDMAALARKGLDYDRVRSAYEEGRPVLDMFRDFARRSGMSVGDYLAHIRTQAKRSQGMSEAEARRTVELEDREAAVAAREQAGWRQAADTRRRADIREFMETFPEAAREPGSIPREVWAEVRGGRSLVAAYARYRGAQAARETARRRNEENAARSAGSMRSAGSGGAGDPFLEGWGE